MGTGVLFEMVFLSPAISIIQASLSSRIVKHLKSSLTATHQDFLNYYKGVNKARSHHLFRAHTITQDIVMSFCCCSVMTEDDLGEEGYTNTGTWRPRGESGDEMTPRIGEVDDDENENPGHTWRGSLEATDECTCVGHEDGTPCAHG
jgi:hypothetical protein